MDRLTNYVLPIALVVLSGAANSYVEEETDFRRKKAKLQVSSHTNMN